MWFKKKIQQGNTPESRSDKVARRIAGAGLKIQGYFATVMSRLFSRLSPRMSRVVWTVFLLLAGAHSVYLIVRAFGDKPHQELHIDPIRTPRHVDQPSDAIIHSEEYVDEQTYRQIVAFRQYMDSLRQHRPAANDSILQQRPGLMDSVDLLEKIYQSQSIK